MASAVLLDGYLLKKKRDDKKSLLVCVMPRDVSCVVFVIYIINAANQRTGDEAAQVARKVSCDTGLAMIRED